MNSNKRRVFLKGTLAAGTVGVAVGAGLLAPSKLLAAWPTEAFGARGMEAAMQAALGTTQMAAGDIEITAPEIAENGAVVPVEVSSAIPGTERIVIIAEKNGLPLVADFGLKNGAEGFVSTRIKMGATSNVRAVVVAGGKTYTAAKEVKVTIGGCGG